MGKSCSTQHIGPDITAATFDDLVLAKRTDRIFSHAFAPGRVKRFATSVYRVASNESIERDVNVDSAPCGFELLLDTI